MILWIKTIIDNVKTNKAHGDKRYSEGYENAKKYYESKIVKLNRSNEAELLKLIQKDRRRQIRFDNVMRELEGVSERQFAIIRKMQNFMSHNRVRFAKIDDSAERGMTHLGVIRKILMDVARDEATIDDYNGILKSIKKDFEDIRKIERG